MPVTKTRIFSLIDDMQKEDPEIRFHALASWSELRDEPFETNVFTLERLIKAASYPFPASVGEWDHPSFYILDFVFQYEQPELIDAVAKHYNGFSHSGKILAMQYLCRIGDEKSLQVLIDILDRDLQTKKAVLLVEDICSRPIWAKKLMERYYGYLETEEYKFSLYRLLFFCLRNELFHEFKQSFILPLLLEDYRKVKEAYREYHDSYSLKNAYTSWKAIYPKIRAEADFYLSLMEYYFNEEIEQELKEALTFADTILQTSALVVCLQRNVAVHEEVLYHCATHITSSEFLYWELLRIRKEHLFPVAENKQRYFARSHLFHYLVSDAELDYFPEQIEIIKPVDTTDYFGNRVRYYLATFENPHGERLVAWAGAYILEEHEDSCYIMENTFITEDLLASRTVDEHCKQLLQRLNKEDQEYDEHVQYASSTKVSKWFYAWYLVVAFRWYQAISEQDLVYAVFSLLLTAVVVGYHLYKRKESKTSSVEIKGYLLRYHHKGSISEIRLQDIQKITIEKASKKARFFDYSAKVVAIYNQNGEKAFDIPMQCVDYRQFTHCIEELSIYLDEAPYIEHSPV